MMLTRILSESIMVLRRWAMVSTVQSMNCSLRASWMMPSVLGTHQQYNKICIDNKCIHDYNYSSPLVFCKKVISFIY